MSWFHIETMVIQWFYTHWWSNEDERNSYEENTEKSLIHLFIFIDPNEISELILAWR